MVVSVVAPLTLGAKGRGDRVREVTERWPEGEVSKSLVVSVVFVVGGMDLAPPGPGNLICASSAVVSTEGVIPPGGWNDFPSGGAFSKSRYLPMGSPTTLTT